MQLIPSEVTRHIARAALRTKRNSPHIFFVGGVIGIIGSTYLACRATLKLEDTVDEIKNDLEQVKVKDKTAMSDSDYRKDLAYVYGKSAKSIGLLYGPSVVLGVASISALTGSHVQLTRRNAALTATLAAVSEAYEKYRRRVQEEIGKERELEIHRAITEEEAEIDGKKETVKVTDPDGWSPYMRFFDDDNPNWKKDSEYNRLFVACQEKYANHQLRSRGHVFLNDVYDSLGMERSRAGAVVGWLRDGDGDGYIDFGMFEAHNKRFVAGFERVVILDFNVDGVIYDKI